jgi:integration host factor subunit beta
MTKSGLVQAISARMSHLNARDVEIVVKAVFDAMTEALANDDRIEIRGFGSFSVRRRRSRQGRNPKTGVSIHVPEKRVPFFTVGHELRTRVDSINRKKELPPKPSAGAGTNASVPLRSTGA